MDMSLEQYHYSLKFWILSAFNDEEELLNIFHFINQFLHLYHHYIQGSMKMVVRIINIFNRKQQEGIHNIYYMFHQCLCLFVFMIDCIFELLRCYWFLIRTFMFYICDEGYFFQFSKLF